MLDRDKKKAHKGYMWVYHAPRLKLTCFDYQKGRSREGPKQFLKHFTGIVQTDGYVVYDYLDEETTIVHLACWAHVRRKFFDAQKNDEARAQHALAEIGLLYGIERFARRIKMNKTEELRHRKDHAHPIMERLYRWAIEERAKMTNSEPIAKAIDYMLGMWKKLKAYANNGITRLDNNLVENQIRPMVIGRKNYLFAGSAKGAKALAIYYSLFACCHLNGVDPYKWLVDVLKRINEQPMYLLKELLPNQVSISE